MGAWTVGGSLPCIMDFIKRKNEDVVARMKCNNKEMEHLVELNVHCAKVAVTLFLFLMKNSRQATEALGVQTPKKNPQPSLYLHKLRKSNNYLKIT